MGGDGETAAQRVHAAFSRADELRQAGRAEDARAGYDAVVNDFGSYQGDDAPYVRRTVAAALAFKALTFKDVAPSQELDALNVVIARFRTDTDTDIRRRVAQALARKGTVLKRMGRLVEARSTWLALLDGFQKGEHPDIDSHILAVKRALVHTDRPAIVKALAWPWRLLDR